MTIPQAQRLMECWIDEPPVFVLLKGVVDAFSSEAKPKRSDWRELMKTPGLVANYQQMRPMPKPEELFGVGLGSMPAPVLDLDALRERNRVAAAKLGRKEHGIKE